MKDPENIAEELLKDTFINRQEPCSIIGWENENNKYFVDEYFYDWDTIWYTLESKYLNKDKEIPAK